MGAPMNELLGPRAGVDSVIPRRGRDSHHLGRIEPTLSEPEPLRRPLPPAEPYPLQALGDMLGSVAMRICDVVRVPAAMAGQSILAAASLAVQGLADVQIDGRLELLSLWAVTIGESGERKTGCDRWALQPHREHERLVLAAYDREKADHDLEVMAYEAASRALAKGKDAEAIHHELSKLGSPPPAPLKPVLIVGSPTIEGVHKQLIGGLPSVGLFHDDAGEFLGGHSMNQDNRTKTAAGLSRLWDCGEFDRVRAGDGSSKHYGKRLALHLMLQPVVAETVLSDDVLTGQGFLARSLLSWPATTIGTRAYVEVDLSTDPAMLRYWMQIKELLSRTPTMRPGSRNELEPRRLTLTSGAKLRWITFHDGIEADMADAGDWASVRAWASKAPAQMLRVAGVLTLIEQPDTGVINVEQIERAATLVNHYLTEAVRIVGTHSVPKSIRDAENLLKWCHESHIELLHSGAALQLGPNAIRAKPDFDQAINELDRSGWATKIDDGAVIDGKHRRRVWSIRGAT